MTVTGKDAGAAGTVRRRRMSPEERRRQLLDLGQEIALERSLEQVTIDEVAERAGVSRALIFHYFESKQDFHVALVQEQAEVMLTRTLPPSEVEDPLAALVVSMSSYLDYVEEFKEHFVGLLRGAMSSDPAMRRVVDGTRAAMARRVLDHAPRLGIEPSPAVATAVRGWTAFVEDVVIRWITDPEPELNRDQILGMLVGSLPALAASASLIE